MGMNDFHKIEKDFDAKRRAIAEKLIALIDKRLVPIRRTIPGAEYGDAMGTSFFSVEGLSYNEQDPMYIATEYVTGQRKVQTEESYGEPLPEYLVKANEVYERHGTEMEEILKISEYLYDEVRHTYS